MRIALIAWSALVAAGCFVGIDTSLIDRDAGGLADAATGEASGPDGGVDSGGDHSLVGSWSFEETSGTVVVDASGQKHDGTLVGTVSRTKGVAGQAIVMDGAQRMEVTSLDGAQFPAAGTLSMWFEFTDALVSSPAEWGLFDVRGIGARRNHFSLQQFPDGASDIHLDFTTAAGQPAASDGLFATSGLWNHVVVTWDLDGYDLYQATQGTALQHVSSGGYDFAWTPSGQQFRVGTAFTGAIDEIRLYARALSPSEVGAIP